MLVDRTPQLVLSNVYLFEEMRVHVVTMVVEVCYQKGVVYQKGVACLNGFACRKSVA